MQKCRPGYDTGSPEWAFRKLMCAHRAAHTASLNKLGLREIGQPMLLFILSDMRRDGIRCTQKELAEIMDRSPSTITISINSLEKRGYIRRFADERDRRCNFVELTDEGLVVEAKCRQVFDDINQTMFGSFSPEERAELARIFNLISSRLIESSDCDNICESEECCI